MNQYIGKILDNRYEILDVIGVGGMAVVYKAYCHRLHRFVAIKILKEDLSQDAEFRRRFHAESQAVAMLSHPNIVSVYDVSHSDNIDYIVMELIEGITLSGGEPFVQAAACADLARAAHGLGLNVWTYTGYLFEHLRDAGDPAWTALLAETDVLVDGPFLQKEKSYELHFRGSRNQRLIDVPASLAQGKVVLWEEEDLLAKFTVPES